MSRKTKRKQKGIDFGNVVNSAIQEGVDSIIKNHPRFKDSQEFIYNHIDQKKLGEMANKAYEYISENPSEKNLKKLYEDMAKYVASGEVLDDLGKEVVLRKGLEEKASSGFFKGFSARRELKGEKKLDYLITSFQDLYSLLKTGNYAERMPELAQAVSTVNDMGFLDPAVDVLKSYGLIDDRKYKALKQGIKYKTEESAKSVVSGIENYITPQKIAASILGIIGISMLVASGTGITGNIIGNLSNTTTGIIGGFLVLASLGLFVWKRR